MGAQTEWLQLRLIFAIAVIAILGWIFFRRHRLQIRDALLCGGMGMLCLWIIAYPSIVDRVLNLGRIREFPLGRVVVLLLLAQLFWLVVLFVLRERSNDQVERFNRLVSILSVELERNNGDVSPEKFREIMVVLPAYREEENVTSVLEKIPKQVNGYSVGVVVVVDGIEDPTANVVQQRFPGAVVLRQLVRVGSGAALLRGYRLCASHGVRVVVSMDSDGQHSPDDLSVLLQPILDGTHDVVIGNRLKGGWEVESTWRFVGLHIFGFIVRVLMRINAWDCSNTYRAFLLDPVMAIGLEEAQYHTLELLFKAHRAGLRIGEVPIRVLARRSGTSKKGNTLYYGYQFFKRLLRYGLSKKVNGMK